MCKIDGCTRHQENFVNKGGNKTSKYKIKELSHLICQNAFRTIPTPCWKTFCNLPIDDKEWYWKLYFCSELTIVSPLYASSTCFIDTAPLLRSKGLTQRE